MVNTKWAFLQSPRFWQLAIIGILAGLTFAIPNNVWVQALSVTVSVWFGGSVVVGTFDRSSDKKVEAAEASVQ